MKQSQKRKRSLAVTLEPIDSIIVDINRLIQTANTAIEENNKTVSNMKKERSTLESQIWRFLFEEVKSDFRQYKENKNRIEKELNSFSTEESEAKSTKEKLEVTLGELNQQATSIESTIYEINKMLLFFGFLNFCLRKSNKEGFYKIVRPKEKGEDARASLSEGEKTFLSFLYFYHLIHGSFSNFVANEYDVIVIDDPISSLDNEVLFLVSHFVKEIIETISRKQERGFFEFNQIFVLTHNIYFHRQITEDYRRKKESPFDHEKFWIVRKFESGSIIESVATNPIKSAYELLETELKVEGKSSISTRIR